MQDRYLLNKSEGKLLGVCSGFARWSGIDPTLARIGAIVLTLLTGPLAVILYFATAWIAPER